MALENQLAPGIRRDILRRRPAILNLLGTAAFTGLHLSGILGDVPQDGLDYAFLVGETALALGAIDAAQFAISSTKEELRAIPKLLADLYRDEVDVDQIGMRVKQEEYAEAISLAERMIARGSSSLQAHAQLAEAYGKMGAYVDQIHTYRRMHDVIHTAPQRKGLIASAARLCRNRFIVSSVREPLNKRSVQSELPPNEFIDDVFRLLVLEGSPIELYFDGLAKKEERGNIDPLTNVLLRVSIDEILSPAWKERIVHNMRKNNPTFAFPDHEQLWHELSDKFIQYSGTLKQGRAYKYHLGKRVIVLKEGTHAETLAEKLNFHHANDALKETRHHAARVFAGPISHGGTYSILFDFVDGLTLAEHPGDHEFTCEDYTSVGHMLGKLHLAIPYENKPFTFTPYLHRAELPEKILTSLATVYPELERIAANLPSGPFIDAHGGNFIVECDKPLSLNVIDMESRGKAPVMLDLAYFIGSMRGIPYSKRMALLRGYMQARRGVGIDPSWTVFQPSYLDQTSLLFIPHLALTMQSRLPSSVAKRLQMHAQEVPAILSKDHNGFYREHKQLIETLGNAAKYTRS